MKRTLRHHPPRARAIAAASQPITITADHMDPQQKDRQYERFMTLFVGCERAIRGYVRSCLTSISDTDDVMQDVGLACWHKFDQFDADGTEEDFIRWCCVIARFEILRFRRSRSRDRLLLSEEVIQLLASEAEQRLEETESERRALRGCLQKLSDPERRLLLSIHTPGDSIAKIAAESNQQARRLYSKLNALRDMISNCVQASLAQGKT